MRNFFNKLSAVIILPSFVFIAAAFPFKCSVAKDKGVFRSQDFGASWEQKVKIDKKQNIANKNILSLAIDPINPSILFLGTVGDGLYKSTDEAETWQKVQDKSNLIDKRADIYDIKINPKNPNILYLAVYQKGFGRVFVSRDSAETWQEIYVVSKEKLPVLVIEVDRINDAIVYIGTAQGGIMKSLDSGSSWQVLGWFEGEILDIKINPKDSQIVYLVASKGGIHKTTNQGQNWQRLALVEKKQEPDKKITSPGYTKEDKARNLMINPSDPRIIHASSENGLWVSSDGGENWRKLNILMPAKSATILSITQDQINSQTIYYAAGSVVYRSQDAGQTWTVHQIPSNKKVKTIKIDPIDSNIVYVGMNE